MMMKNRFFGQQQNTNTNSNNSNSNHNIRISDDNNLNYNTAALNDNTTTISGTKKNSSSNITTIIYNIKKMITTIKSNYHNNNLNAKLFIIIGYLFGLITAAFLSLLSRNQNYTKLFRPSNDQTTSCIISYGKYHGTEYMNPGITIGTPKCLLESKFIKIQQHHVQFPNTNNNIINDWIWIDYHERINVLVEAPNHKPNHFIIFQQSKYALENHTSYAIIGGIVEPNEIHEPMKSAQREVHEELNIYCNQYKLLGRYRTDVNRGMGWTNTYHATNCSYLNNKNTINEGTMEDINNNNVIVGGADVEKQDIIILSLSDIIDAVLHGKFLEIQWTATISLALLQLLVDDERNKQKMMMK